MFRRLGLKRTITLVVTILLLLTLSWIFISYLFLQFNESKLSEAEIKEMEKINIEKKNKILNLEKDTKKKIKNPTKVLNVKEPIRIVNHREEDHQESTNFSEFTSTTINTQTPSLEATIIIATDINHLQSVQKTLDELKKEVCETFSPKLKVSVLIVSLHKFTLPENTYCDLLTIHPMLEFNIKNRTKGIQISNLELYNYGMNIATGKYVLFIPRGGYPSHSSDSWFTKMVQTFEDQSLISAIGGKVINSKNEIVSAGLDVALQNNDSPVLYHRYSGQSLNYGIHKEEEMICVSTTGMMIRKEDFKPFETGNSPIHSLIESDFCLSLITKGKKILYSPKYTFFTNSEPNKLKIPKLFQSNTIKLLKKQQRNNWFSKWKTLLKDIVTKRYEINPNMNILWDFGGGSCTGWFNEATNFVTGLERRIPLKVITGKDDFCKGLPATTRDSLIRQISRQFSNVSIWISHKPPPNYPKFPYNGLANFENEPDYVIGRSMYESTRIEQNWVKNSVRADEIWVPSKFLVKAFVDSGVDEKKIRVIPEPLDIHFYNPETTTPLPIKHKKGYNFFSNFKWEDRKGPEYLLRAYFKEFTKSDNVNLYLLTYVYGDRFGHSTEAVEREIRKIAEDNNFDIENLPNYHIISKIIPTIDMPRLYKNFDAFVLPTRGEGW